MATLDFENTGIHGSSLSLSREKPSPAAEHTTPVSPACVQGGGDEPAERNDCEGWKDFIASAKAKLAAPCAGMTSVPSSKIALTFPGCVTNQAPSLVHRFDGGDCSCPPNKKAVANSHSKQGDETDQGRHRRHPASDQNGDEPTSRGQGQIDQDGHCCRPRAHRHQNQASNHGQLWPQGCKKPGHGWRVAPDSN